MSTDELLARSRVLTHPSGLKVTTPLLVPSFSSKGFPPLRDGKPWVSKALEITAEWLTDTMLISAYDIHHRHIPPPLELPFTPELTFIDSGGYEAGLDEDLGAVSVREHRPKAWTADHLANVYTEWPARFPAVLVSYDHPDRRIPLLEQIDEARTLFRPHPDHMHSLLLKPATQTQGYLTKVLEELNEDAAIVSEFDMIGVTEKELGNTILDRMQRIAELRLALDAAGVGAPIQVFGALDPLSSCLYFIAGAEIFDGLTWLRYAYRDGMCIYRANYGALVVGVDRRDSLVDAKILADNVSSLLRLEASMRRVALAKTVTAFEHHAPLLSQAFDDLRVKLQKGHP